MSQGELAERLSVSYQQVQKYESGITRLTVDRVYQLARALQVPFSRLLPSGGDSEVGELATDLQPSAAPPAAHEQREYRLDDEELRVVKLFRRIKSPELRQVVLKYLRAVAESDRRLP